MTANVCALCDIVLMMIGMSRNCHGVALTPVILFANTRLPLLAARRRWPHRSVLSARARARQVISTVSGGSIAGLLLHLLLKRLLETKRDEEITREGTHCRILLASRDRYE